MLSKVKAIFNFKCFFFKFWGISVSFHPFLYLFRQQRGESIQYLVSFFVLKSALMF